MNASNALVVSDPCQNMLKSEVGEDGEALFPLNYISVSNAQK